MDDDEESDILLVNFECMHTGCAPARPHTHTPSPVRAPPLLTWPQNENEKTSAMYVPQKVASGVHVRVCLMY